jgi:Uma2 family endonuclease
LSGHQPIWYSRKVPEYWIAHPVDKTIMVFQLAANREYGKPLIYTGEDPIPVSLFPDLVIDLKKVFRD